ncbi:MAG: hypothetical protein E6H47_10085 [Betaproteobacteria bacterium]|nr:MAG: hypothetical protein E6H47_10085 [Betaproteobacteria bacterium]
MIKNLAIALLLLISAAFARAQDYPKGPITLVIPLAPGDATDTSARAVADELSRELNVPVVAVNRPGAGGALGTSVVVKARNVSWSRRGTTVTPSRSRTTPRSCSVRSSIRRTRTTTRSGT